MIKNIFLVSFLAISSILYGIDVGHLRENKIFYFLDSVNGTINKINIYTRSVEPLTLDKIPLFLSDFCWGRGPTYIFCEDEKLYNGTSAQVKALLGTPGRKCIHIGLQDNTLDPASYNITCIFQQWPGLDKVSKNADYDNNRGIMLFPLIPFNPHWYAEMGKVTIYTDFWKEFNNSVVGENYFVKPFISDKPGHLCIALPCLANYYNDTLSFFCPMKNSSFSLNLQSTNVRFSNQLYTEKEPKQYVFIMDIWSFRTQMNGISVQVFK